MSKYRVDMHNEGGMFRASIIEDGLSFRDGFVAGKWCDSVQEANAFIERKLMELGAQTKFMVVPQ